MGEVVQKAVGIIIVTAIVILIGLLLNEYLMHYAMQYPDAT